MKKEIQFVKGRLARKLSLYVIFASTLIAIFSTSLQIYNEFQHDIEMVHSGLEQIEKTHLTNVSSRVWQLETQDLKITLNGLLDLPYIQSVAIYADGELLLSSGTISEDNVVVKKYPLYHRFNGGNKLIGELVVQATLDGIYHKIFNRAMFILFTNAIKTFIVAALILLIFHRLVARHLNQIARFSQNLNIDTLHKELIFNRQPNAENKYDELDMLQMALSHMQRNLQQATQEVVESEQDLKTTLNSIGDAVITTDEKGNITRMNPVAELLTGWSFIEAKNKPVDVVFSIIDASTRKMVSSPIEKVLKMGRTVYLSNHTTLISKDGSEYQIADSAAPIRSGNGAILGMVLVFNDVTEQYQLRQVAIKHKKHLQAIMDNSPAVIYVKDVKGRFTFVNKRFEQFHNIERKKLVGLTAHDIFPNDVAQILQSNDNDVFETKQSLEVEEFIPREEGVHTYVSVKFFIAGDTEKENTVCSISTDITERKKMENMLRENAQRFELWKESNFIGILHTWSDGRIIEANKMMLDMLGYTKKELLEGNMDWVSLTPREYAPLDQKAMLEAQAKGFWTPFEKEFYHKEGHRIPILIGGSKYRDDGDDGDEFIVFIIDLSERNQQEEKLRRSQKMEALGKLTGGIAHDYNNMLGVILGFAELLERSLTDQPKLEQFCQKIIHAGERSADLTKKLLAFSSKRNTNLKSININGLLKYEQQIMEKTLTARIALDYQLSDDLWSIKVDSGDFEDMVINLSINAMHAIQDSGRLTIKTSNEHISDTDAKISLVEAGDYVLLTLSDTGCGMPKEIVEKIFDPFFSTKGEKGTGLGLSQVYSFVERCGGVINVYSELGVGTRFSLYFPRFEQDEKNDHSSIEQVILANKSNGERILVVDDELALLNLSCEVLNDHGYVTFQAENAMSALDILSKEKIDLVFSDVIMPEMNGFQLAKEVTSKYPHIKIQLASGFSDSSHIELAGKDLHRHVLHKPFKSQELLQRIQVLLAKK
ncbi:MAG: PAS domain S-box-containing protein [Alteromonadaceae bacterium]|jgi:PAS domain S-box-containing protein